MKMNPVVHFELPAEDRRRMADFYARVFGWQTKQLGPEMGDYVVVTTTESDENGPKRPGAINGGFSTKTKDNQYPTVVVAVDDIKKAMKRVEEAGGRCLADPMHRENLMTFPASDCTWHLKTPKATGSLCCSPHQEWMFARAADAA